MKLDSNELWLLIWAWMLETCHKIIQLYRLTNSWEMVYIGIDLGTTYSCAAIIENGRPRIIYNEEGKTIIKSPYLFFPL